MKKFILSLVLFAGFAVVAGAQEVTYSVSPKMNCGGCAARVKKALTAVKGVNEVVTDLEKQTVTVKYDEKVAKKEDFVKAMADAKYTITEAKQGGCCKDKAAAGDAKGHCNKAQGHCNNAAKKDCCEEQKK